MHVKQSKRLDNDDDDDDVDDKEQRKNKNIVQYDNIIYVVTVCRQ